MTVLERTDLFANVFGSDRGHKQRDAIEAHYVESVLDGLYSQNGFGLSVYTAMAATRANTAHTGHIVEADNLLHLWERGNVKRIPKRSKYNPFTAQMRCGVEVAVTVENRLRTSKWYNAYHGDIAVDEPQCCPQCRLALPEFSDLDLDYLHQEDFGRIMSQSLRNKLWKGVHADILETQRLPIWEANEVAQESLRRHGHQITAEKFVAQQERILQLIFPGQITDLTVTTENILDILRMHHNRNSNFGYTSFVYEDQCKHIANDLREIAKSQGKTILPDTIAKSAEYEAASAS